MMGIQDLCERFGLSDKAVRRRLDALNPVLAPYLTRGGNNAILVSDPGVQIFDRLVQVERESKRGLNAAAQVVIEEARNGGKPEDEPRKNDGNPLMVIELLKEQLHESRRREEDLRAERDRLLSIIEDRDEQLRALLPGPPEESTPTPTGNGGRGRMSRWHAFKYALLGR